MAPWFVQPILDLWDRPSGPRTYMTSLPTQSLTSARRSVPERSTTSQPLKRHVEAPVSNGNCHPLGQPTTMQQKLTRVRKANDAKEMLGNLYKYLHCCLKYGRADYVLLSRFSLLV